MWTLAGRPGQGLVYESIKQTNAKYKCAIQSIIRNEQRLRSDSLAGKLLINKVKDFWKEVQVLNRNQVSLFKCFGLSNEGQSW